MTDKELEAIGMAIAEVSGAVESLGFIVSLPRFSEEERGRHERLALRQAAKLRSINDRLRAIRFGGK